MIAFGVLLIALAVLAGVVVAAEATDAVSITVLGATVRTDGIGMFAIGAATMLVAVLGIWLVGRGIRQSYRVRRENRQLRKEHKRLEKEGRGTPATFAGNPDADHADADHAGTPPRTDDDSGSDTGTSSHAYGSGATDEQIAASSGDVTSDGISDPYDPGNERTATSDAERRGTSDR